MVGVAGSSPVPTTSFNRVPVPEYAFSRLAQLVEHHLDMVGVAGSSPVPTTIFLL